MPFPPTPVGSSLAPLDGALRFLRARAASLLGRYVVAAGPLAAAMWVAIDVVSAQDRAAVPRAAGLLIAAMFWRWIALADLQRRVLAGAGMQRSCRLRRRLAATIVLRLSCAQCLTWGACLVVLPFWGFFLGSFAVPALLRHDGPAAAEIAALFGRITASSAYLARAGAALAVLFFLGALAMLTCQLAAAHVLLPALLGIDTSDMRLAMSHPAWWLVTLGVLLMAFDLYWTIAAVFVCDRMWQQRTGSDLRLRLAAMTGEVP